MLTVIFFNDTANTEIYTLSLHDALPILNGEGQQSGEVQGPSLAGVGAAAVEFQVATGRMPLARPEEQAPVDRKSTRLNSSHANISYAVFCLKKTKKSENISMSFLSTQPR